MTFREIAWWYSQAVRIERERAELVAARLAVVISETISSLFIPREPEPVCGGDALRQAFGGF